MNGLQVVSSIGLLLGILALAMALIRSRSAAADGNPNDTSHIDLPQQAESVDGRHMSADTARNKVLIMMDGHAFWSEIMNTLNPTGDSALTDMLRSLQGPHIDPMTSLTILNDELKAVLKTKPTATLEDALRRIKGDMAMEYQTRMGD